MFKIDWPNLIIGAIAGAIIGAILSPFITPIIENIKTPTNDIVIYSQTAQLFDSKDAINLLNSKYSEKIAIKLIQGCQPSRIIEILYDYENIEENENVYYTGKNIAGRGCDDCTDHHITIKSKNNDELKNIKIEVSLFSNDYETFDQEGLTITDGRSLKGDSSFTIDIDTLNNERIIKTSLRTKEYQEMNFDCSVKQKQNCEIKKLNIAQIIDQELIEEIRGMLKTTYPEININKLETFYYNQNQNKFEKGTVGYAEVSGDNCQIRSPYENPKDTISKIQ